MSEKRYRVVDDDFSKWVVDTTLTEDRHEGTLYTAYDMCRELNRLNNENEQLRNIIKQKEKEEQLYAKEILRLNELNKQTSDFTDILGGY